MIFLTALSVSMFIALGLALIQLLLALGAPLGKFLFGGKFKVLPFKLRIVSGLLSAAFAVIGFLFYIKGGACTAFPPAVNVALAVYTAFLGFAVFGGGLITKSKREKHFITPVAALGFICGVIVLMKFGYTDPDAVETHRMPQSEYSPVTSEAAEPEDIAEAEETAEPEEEVSATEIPYATPMAQTEKAQADEETTNGNGVTANASSGNASATVSAAVPTAGYAPPEILSQYESYEEFIEFPDEGYQKIIISISAPVTDFKFIEILPAEENLAEEAANIYWAGAELFSLDELRPEKPFAVTWMNWGSFPHRGISFKDASGAVKYYYIQESGRDGSLLLGEFTN